MNSMLYSLMVVTAMKVKTALFFLGHNNAPRPYGYHVEFFIESWEVVGGLLTEGVLNFFQHNKLLNEVSNIVITLAPKVINATSQMDYRFISCCNVIYKCISKIMANRVVSVLPALISREQSAFVPSRCIADNVLLAHELVHAYQSQKGPSHYALKVDLMKAFDSVEWNFLHPVLNAFDFLE